MRGRASILFILCAALGAGLFGCAQEEQRNDFWTPPSPHSFLDTRSLHGPAGPERPSWDLLGVTDKPSYDMYTNPVYDGAGQPVERTWWEQVQDDLEEIFDPEAAKRRKNAPPMFPELKPVMP